MEGKKSVLPGVDGFGRGLVRAGTPRGPSEHDHRERDAKTTQETDKVGDRRQKAGTEEKREVFFQGRSEEQELIINLPNNLRL